MRKSQNKINFIDVKIEMLRKGIEQRDLRGKFKVTQSAISHALCGRRPTLLSKISKYVKEQ